MMYTAESDAQPQSTLWMLDLGQPLPVGPVLQVPVVFMRAGPEVAQELAHTMDLDDQAVVLQLKAGEAYIWNCATLPAYRGQRFYPALLAHIVGELHHQGLRRVWIGTETDNLPSQSGIIQAGFQPIGDVVISRVLTMRRAWMQGRPGIPEQLVIDARYALLGEGEEVLLAANSGEHSASIMDLHGQPG